MTQQNFTAPGLIVTRFWDRWNGVSFVAWKPGVSAGFTERKELLKFVAWPAKTPTGDRLREWLSSFEQPAEVVPVADKTVELQATGFGPECHLDESDPNYQTRTVL
jgi:hypothetical protein